MSNLARMPRHHKPLPFVCERGHTYEAECYYDGAVHGWLAVDEDGECPICEENNMDRWTILKAHLAIANRHIESAMTGCNEADPSAVAHSLVWANMALMDAPKAFREGDEADGE